jgi:putative hemolysin
VGEVQEIEQDIVERVFHIGDRKVNSLMTHRNDVEYLTMEDTFAEIKEKILNEMHSVYPVCEDNLDEVKGIVLLKDLFVGLEQKDFKLTEITREATYLIEHTSAYKALENFKTTKNHQALIVDEHGIFQGIITLNDILEALVGDASDFDEDEYQLVAEVDGTWTVDGQYSLHDFLTYFDMDDLIGDYEVTTVSGLITTEMGYIPKQGELLIWNKMQFTILETAGAKVEKIRVAPYVADY